MDDQSVASGPLKRGHVTLFFLNIILHTKDLKLIWVHDPPIGVAKSAPAAHRHITLLPKNQPHVLLSLDVKHCSPKYIYNMSVENFE